MEAGINDPGGDVVIFREVAAVSFVAKIHAAVQCTWCEFF